MRVSFQCIPFPVPFRPFRLITTAVAAFGLLTTASASAQTATQFAGTAVGQSSAAVPVIVTIHAGGTAAAPVAVTQGVANLDFSVVPGGTCTAGSAVGTCTAMVVFTPMYPGLRSGAVVIKSSDGTMVLGSTPIAGVGTGALSVLDPGDLKTVAGDTYFTYDGDHVPATSAALFLPYSVTVDPSGQIYIADTMDARVRKVGTDGTITTIAGNGMPGYSGDNGQAASAQVNSPAGLALDGAGNIYFADSGNDVIRRIDAVSGVITTVAGTPGSAGFSGDGGPATSAQLSGPEGIAFDAAGDLLIADTGNGAIRRVDAGSGLISTVAGAPPSQGYSGEGSATAKMLNMPWGVAVGLDGALYIADTGNNRIRRVIGGVLSTVAGTGAAGYSSSDDGAPANQAELNQPHGVALDPAGDLYIADSENERIRKVSPGSGVGSTAVIQTIIGDGTQGVAGDPGPANQAELYGPFALVFAQNGDLYFADTLNSRIREVVATPFTMPAFHDTKATKLSDDVQTENVDSDGNADLQLNAPTLSNAALDSGTTTCSFTGPTTLGTSCTVGVRFAPASVGDGLPVAVTLGANAANTPAVIESSGNGLDVNPTTVTVTSSANPTVTGTPVTLTAVVSNGNAGALTGTVTFTDGATVLCNSATISNGAAGCLASFSTVGTHTITANYSGDANNEAISGTFAETVKQTPTVSLTVTPTEATVGSTIQMSVTVTAPSGTPTGTVTLYWDSTAFMGPATFVDGSIGVYTNVIPPGHHTVWVSYSGDTTNAPANSNQVAVVIDQAATTTALSTNNADPTVGQSVTLTAVVGPTHGFTPTGTVIFTDNGAQLGTATLNASFTAALTVNSLSPGAHSIVATYEGDTDDAVSSSTAVSEQVATIQTSTTMSADANPLSAGATLHLTATVALVSGATADGALTGTVTFTDGGTTLNTVAIDGSGHATLALSSLSVGTHTIVATYNGATNYATSNSASLSEQVQQTTTTVALTTSAASVLAGKPASFTAIATSSTGVPTGSITFKDGVTVLGTVALTGQGSATFTTSTLTVATHNITAVYSGDSNYSASTSAAVTETVSLAQPVVTLSGPANAVDVSTAVVLTGTITGPGVTPTGTLTLLDGTTAVASQAVAANGQFRFSTSTLSLGTRSLSVAYSGDTDNATASSATLSVTIQLAPTATALSVSSNPGTVGQPVTLTASVISNSPGVSGSVSFMDGASSLGTAPLSTSGTASLTTSALGFGVQSITASYGGDAQHAASTSAATSERMTEPASATLTSSANPAIAGSSVALTAVIAANGAGTATGTVQFSDGPMVLGSVALNAAGSATLQTSSLAVGQHAITVSYGGDSNVASTSATLTETIVSATTAVSLSSSSSLPSYGSPLTLTASVTSNGLTATGPVTFIDGGTTIGSATLNAQGVASLTTDMLSLGTHNIVARYAGDADTSASASPAIGVVVKQTTSLALSSSVNPALTESPITLTASLKNAGAAAASGTVVFSEGSTQLGTGLLNANGVATLTLTALPAGSQAIAASYAGDGVDFASNSPTLTEVVNLRSSATTLTASHTDSSNPQEVTLIAVVQGSGPSAPSGAVSFTSGTVQIGTASINGDGVATLTILLDESSRTEDIVAQYGGDSVYAASNSSTTAVQAGPATQFTLAINPAAINIVTKQHATVQLSLNSVAGFSDTIQLGCLGLPFAATCTFSTPETKLAAGGTSNVQLTIDTGDPLGVGAQSSAKLRGTGRGVLWCGLPALLLAGLLRRRRRLAYAWISLVCLTVMISGCSGLQGSSTPAGSYSFKVTASGVGSGATQSQVVTLTVTQ